MRQIVVSGFLAVCLSDVVLAQGSLTPPGAPDATMKTLEQVYEAVRQEDPRTVITNLPYTITVPGSYCLGASLTSAYGGVSVLASRVTLDFNGFSITGSRGVSYQGVTVGDPHTTNQFVVIQNGIITDFGTGVFIRNVDNVVIQNMQIVSNLVRGVDVYPYQGNSKGNRISKCQISNNDGIGIYFEPTTGTCNGNVIEDCIIQRNGGVGIYLFGGNGTCQGTIVQRNSIGENMTFGISETGTEASVIQDNHIWKQRGNTTYGIYALGTGSFVVRNICVGNTNNITTGPYVTSGPVVTNSGILSTSGAAMSPWANFSR